VTLLASGVRLTTGMAAVTAASYIPFIHYMTGAPDARFKPASC
jgi:hypothetical protein